MSTEHNDIEVLHYWSTRKMSYKVMLYLTIIFIVFIMIAHYGLHSSMAVKGLIYTAIGAIASTLPIIFKRIEYRLTSQRLEYRHINKKEAEQYKTLFLLEQVEYLVKIKSGFKFYLTLKDKTSIQRFWKKFILDNHSGVVRLRKEDTERVMTIFEKLGISLKGKY